MAAAPGAGQGRRRSVRTVSSAPRRGCAGRAERKSRRGRDGRRAGDSEGGLAPTGEAGPVRPRGPQAPPADRRRLGGQRAGAPGAISLPRGLSQALGAEAGLQLTLFHRSNPIRRSYFCGFPPRACPCLLKNVTAPRVVICSEEKLLRNCCLPFAFKKESTFQSHAFKTQSSPSSPHLTSTESLA